MAEFWKYHGLGNDFVVIEECAPISKTKAWRLVRVHTPAAGA